MCVHVLIFSSDGSMNWLGFSTIWCKIFSFNIFMNYWNRAIPSASSTSSTSSNSIVEYRRKNPRSIALPKPGYIPRFNTNMYVAHAYVVICMHNVLHTYLCMYFSVVRYSKWQLLYSSKWYKYQIPSSL